MYSITNENGQYYTVKNFSEMTFTSNPNLRYTFELNKAQQMLSYLEQSFPNMVLNITK
tara:strand:+ start:305 stop:478 length:174 start_codon:yes stop_codon:yes gene_type:complete